MEDAGAALDTLVAVLNSNGHYVVVEFHTGGSTVAFSCDEWGASHKAFVETATGRWRAAVAAASHGIHGREPPQRPTFETVPAQVC